MATAFKRTTHRPLPRGAEVVTQRGQPYARWKDPQGKTRKARVGTFEQGSRKGEQCVLIEAECYTLSYFDENSRRRPRMGFTDKGESDRLGRKLEDEARARRAGLTDGKAEAYKAHEDRPLTEHLQDFRQNIEHRGKAKRYAVQTHGRVAKLCTLAKAKRLSHLNRASIERALSVLRDTEDVSGQTLNHYVRCAKQFSRWLRDEGRTRDDALAGMKPAQVTELRHERRALSADEQRLLVAAAEGNGSVLGTSGPDRAMLYRAGLGTGFRANELRSLTPECFDLNAQVPTITVHAGHTKNGKLAEQPVTPELADRLRPWLADKDAGEPVFRAWRPRLRTYGPLPEDTAGMIRTDLRRARAHWLRAAEDRRERRQRLDSDFLKAQDSAGRLVDFHALRHSYASGLAAAGVAPKLAMDLLRHSDINLTLRHYSHTVVRDRAAEVSKLPSLEPDAPQRQRATGTCDLAASAARAADAQRAGVFSCHKRSPHVSTTPSESAPSAQSASAQKTLVLQGKHAVTLPGKTEEEGFEPPVRFPAQRFSKPSPSATRALLQINAA